MAKAGREIIGLVCKECKSQNYATTRNKVNMQTKSDVSKLTINKFCKNCKKKTEHKERLKLR